MFQLGSLSSKFYHIAADKIWIIDFRTILIRSPGRYARISCYCTRRLLLSCDRQPLFETTMNDSIDWLYGFRGLVLRPFMTIYNEQPMLSACWNRWWCNSLVRTKCVKCLFAKCISCGASGKWWCLCEAYVQQMFISKQQAIEACDWISQIFSKQPPPTKSSTTDVVLNFVSVLVFLQILQFSLFCTSFQIHCRRWEWWQASCTGCWWGYITSSSSSSLKCFILIIFKYQVYKKPKLTVSYSGISLERVANEETS
jgi:hypothetical protein